MREIYIKRICLSVEELEERLDQLVETAEPVIITGLDLGPAVGTWSAESLAEKLKNRTFSIHKGTNPVLDFRTKNFDYENQYPAAKFIQECAQGDVRYLRTVGKNFRKDTPDFWKDYPEISDDLREVKIPRKHSSILRISPENLEIWLHYDTLDNILTQVTGTKEVLLFDPNDAKNLYLEGDKSHCSGIISELERWL